jgi:hypothetical protein
MKEILKTVLDFIKENHPDAVVFLVDEGCFKAHSGGKSVLGYRKNLYSGGGWNINIGHPVTPEMVYNVKAVYNDDEIKWSGRILNGKVEELIYENIKPR